MKRFKQLIHYICWRCEDPSELGATKLNKILWFSDAHRYYWTGEPITGAVYVARQFGPVPHQILVALSQLETEGKLAIRNSQHFGHPKKEFFALQKPDLSGFSGEEISLVDDAIEQVCKDHTARSISDISHNDIWKMAEIGEEIPYETVLVSRLGEITEHEVEWAKAQIEELEIETA